MCNVTFIAGATMEKDFEGKATSRVCRVTYREERNLPVMDLDIEFNWADISTAHEKRDQRMREHFLIAGRETIRGTARGISLPSLDAASPASPLAIPISMVMGGVTNQLTGLVTNRMIQTDDLQTFDVEFTISQEKFGYEPITLLAFMSVRDEVAARVNFKLPAAPEVPGAPPPDRKNFPDRLPGIYTRAVCA
ncbi:MAG: YceI family protein [Kiritimatiellia bacterium]